MFDLTRKIGLALAFTTAIALPSLAQETTTETPPAEAPAEGTAAPAETAAPAKAPELYVKSEHGDWKLRCARMEDGSDPCELYQLLKDEKGNSVAEATIMVLPEGQEAVLGATIVVPLETLLVEQLRFGIDTAEPKRYPFLFCAPVGCFARMGLTSADLEAMKKGAKGVVTVVPTVAADKTVSVDMSLKGFTDAYTALLAETPKKQ